MNDSSSVSSDRRPNLAWRKLIPLNLIVALGALLLWTAMQTPGANAAATASQCNGEMNGGGTEVACTVTVTQYLTATGALASAPASTLTMTRCVGATGPVSTLTCATTVTTLSEPVSTVRQCNGSGSGGGGAVVCTVTVRNFFVGSPASPTAATVYQCVGSVITGTGAPGTCTPSNTPGITSVSQATVGQCNGSGNGGTNVGFICTVSSGSTTTASFPVNVDQCNGSGNGGGALVTCQAEVTNQVTPGTPAATGTPAAGTATATPSVSPTASGTATATRTGTPVTPTATMTRTPGPSATPTPTSPGASPSSTPVAPAPSVAPRPPATGNSDSPATAHGVASTSSVAALAGFGMVVTGLLMLGRRRSRQG